MPPPAPLLPARHPSTRPGRPASEEVIYKKEHNEATMTANTTSNVNTKRKRGGQPGNTNALKHGFYSHRFNNLELADLGTALSDGLTDEIALLRVIIRRVFEYADTDAQSLDTWSQALNTLGAASTRLAGLLRTQQLIAGDNGDVISVLSQAIGEVAHDLGLSDPAGN